MDDAQKALCDQEVSALLAKKAVVTSEFTKDCFVSNIFVIPKKLKGYRPVINLKKLNSFLNLYHFKMEGSHLLKSLVIEGDYFVKVDLKDAYFTVAIHPDHTKYLKFRWKGVIYMFTSLPLGLASAPWAFTKLLRVVIAVLRKQGVRLIIYLDDLLFMARSPELVIRDAQSAINLLQYLGFIVNFEKSDLFPKQTMEFLGLLVDSKNLSLSLPEDKIISITQSSRSLLVKDSISVREAASMLGSFSWATAALAYGQAHYRALQAQHIQSLSSPDQRFSLSEASKADLRWWISNLESSNGKSWRQIDPDLIIYSDASLSGWGGTCKGVNTSGPWTWKEKCLHINQLELLAAFNCLRAFAPYGENMSVLLFLDNATAVAYINRRGGSHSSRLNSVALSLTNWCELRRIIVQAIYLPGIQNCIADAESRRGQVSGDWMLSSSIFRAIASRWEMSVDLFASSWNAQLVKFVSWLPQPGAWRTDALTFCWKGEKGYAFPPFALIKDCLAKIRREEAELVLIAPYWPSQPWYPVLLELAVAPPLVIPQSNDMLTAASGEAHPLSSLLLLAWKLSGLGSAGKAFRLQWSTCWWREYVDPHTLLISRRGQAGVAGVYASVPIPCFLL